MVKIPDASSVSRDIASGQRMVRGIDTRSFAPTELAQSIGRMVDKRDKYETTKAETAFLTAKNTQDNAYDQDTDYGTIEERYNTEMDKSLGEVSMGITNPAARAEFINRNKLRIGKGRERIKKVAFGKERDFERNHVNESLVKMREIAVTGDPEDVNNARQTVGGLIDSAIEMGYYDNEEAGKIKRQWRTDSAVGRLNTMDAAGRIEALKMPWAKDLPSDVRQKLHDQAEEATFAQKAVDTVDEYLLADMDRGEAMAKAGEIEDERLRTEVERRYDYMHKQQKEFKSESQFEASDKYAKMIINNELNANGTPFTIDDIPKEDLDLLTASQQISLHKLQSSTAGQSRKVSDRKVIDRLYGLKSAGQTTKLRDYFMDNRDSLNTSDYDTWSEVSHKGTATPEIESFFTDSNRFTKKIEGAKITDQDKVNKLSERFDTWYKATQVLEGKKPSDTQIDYQMDRLLMEVPIDISFMPFDSESVYLFEATNEEMEEAVEELKTDSSDTYKDIIEYLKNTNIDSPSNTQIIEAYNDIKN